MLPLTLALTMASAPTLVRVEMLDALRLPNGFESPAPNPLVIFIRAPASWVAQGALTDAARKKLLAQLYGGPDWERGNGDGSTYVVKRFSSRLVAEGEAMPEQRGTYWYEVKADGTLDKRGPQFGPPAEPPTPKSLIDSAIPGSVFKQGVALSNRKAALEWLARQQGLVKLAVTLKRGQVGFVGRGAKAGALEFHCVDSKLGISLADRARQACGSADTCELWLIGRWGKDAEGFVLDVSRFDGSVSGLERSEGMAGYAWYQAG